MNTDRFASKKISVFISHTTQDKRDLTLAHKIAKALRSQGIDVWIAPDNIPAGNEWEPQLVQALLEKCTHFLVIISSSSISSKWVLNEIELAKNRYEKHKDLKIIPLYVQENLEFIYGDFLKSLQLLPYRSELKALLDELYKALGITPRYAFGFYPLINLLTHGFVGREFVFKATKDFIDNSENGYFIIEGDPGIGKSAIIAEYVKQKACIAHFNSRATGIISLRDFLDSILSQIIAKYSLPYHFDEIPQRFKENSRFLIQLLDEVVGKAPDEKIVIAVDALDEVEMRIQNTSNILQLPTHLPKNIYFILSSRRQKVNLVTHAPVHAFDISDHPKDNERDVMKYIAAQIESSENIREFIAHKGVSDRHFSDQITDKSELNFMYLKSVLTDIHNGWYTDIELTELPQGLSQYYEDHWKRMGMIGAINAEIENKIKIVYVLATVILPVSRGEISSIVGVDNLKVQGVLDEWQQFLHEVLDDGEKLYSVYHNSFREFLHRKDIVDASDVSIQEINSLIARKFRESLDF